MPHDRAATIVVENNHILKSGDMVKLHWSPDSILPTEEPDSYTIDVVLRTYDEESRTWISTDLATNVPNSGYIEVLLPERSPKSDNESGVPTVFLVRVSEPSSETQISKRGIFSKLIKNVIRAITFVTRVVVSVLFPSTEIIRRLLCEAWGLTQSRTASQQIASELPACPCTVSEVTALGNTFKEEGISSVIFHPGSDRCFRQRNP